MRLAGQPWLQHPATQRVCATLTAQGAAAYFVGGCVRNALMGVPVADIDLATDATPEEVLELAKAAGIKAIPTGIDHGTVTLVEGHIPHEVTTFRRDVATDGRRAVVAFSKDIAEDAARRDFTMNALYARPDGALVDPLKGLLDLEHRRVRFIGNAGDRIREDHLRTLRYFRFHAWYGNHDAGFDPEALAAIAENLEGLTKLSKERITSELLKLLAAQDPAPSVAIMRQTGVLGQILPGADDRALAILIHLEGERSPDPVCRLSTLGGSNLQEHLRLSKQQARRHDLLRQCAEGSAGAAEIAYRHDADTAYNALVLRAALLEQPLAKDVEQDIALGSDSCFPVSAQDLMPDLSGSALGTTLKQLEATWIASGFALGRDELLNSLK